MQITERKLNAVRNLGAHLQFVSDSQDVQAIHEHLGPESLDYDAFFVDIKDGEYSEVWGIVGIVPYLSKLASRFV